MPRLTLSPQVVNQDPTPPHQHRRLAMFRRVLNNDSLPLRTRTAAALVLLYAQPVTRIVRLTLEDVTDDGTNVTVCLGDPPSSLPKPAVGLMRAYIQCSQPLPYASSEAPAGSSLAASPDSRWTRPAPSPPARDRCPSTVRQGLRDSPARPPGPGPVVAKALGYHDKTATRFVTESGGTWSRYAPGDHTR